MFCLDFSRPWLALSSMGLMKFSGKILFIDGQTRKRPLSRNYEKIWQLLDQTKGVWGKSWPMKPDSGGETFVCPCNLPNIKKFKVETWELFPRYWAFSKAMRILLLTFSLELFRCVSRFLMQMEVDNFPEDAYRII